MPLRIVLIRLNQRNVNVLYLHILSFSKYKRHRVYTQRLYGFTNEKSTESVNRAFSNGRMKRVLARARCGSVSTRAISQYHYSTEYTAITAIFYFFYQVSIIIDNTIVIPAHSHEPKTNTVIAILHARFVPALAGRNAIIRLATITATAATIDRIKNIITQPSLKKP